MRAPGRLAEVFAPQRRRQFLMMRLTASEKDEIRTAAKTVGTSMTAYLVGLHRYAVGRKAVAQ